MCVWVVYELCVEMQPPHQHQRINLAELKAQIVKKLGPEGSKQYFYYLHGFLSFKLSKVEFNKLCLRILGRENSPLHNQLIHSILKNASSAKIPPPIPDKEVLKPVGTVLSNGNIGPLAKDRKIVDRSIAFGPNGKTSFVSKHSSMGHDNNSFVVSENGDITPHDIRRPVQHHQGLTEKAGENEREVSRYHSANSSATKRLPDVSVSAYIIDPVEAPTFEGGKEVFTRSLLQAPLGVPYCPVSVGGARKTIPLESSSHFPSSFERGGLLGTAALRQRMEQIAALQGLEGVTTDCANLLNNGLDAYLKGLISSCYELVRARSGHAPRNSSINKHDGHLKLVNGVKPGHHHHIQSSSNPTESIQERKPHCPLSLLDFRVAMEVNPHQLGEDWPLLLEKISTRAFEE